MEKDYRFLCFQCFQRCEHPHGRAFLFSVSGIMSVLHFLTSTTQIKNTQAKTFITTTFKQA